MRKFLALVFSLLLLSFATTARCDESNVMSIHGFGFATAPADKLLMDFTIFISGDDAISAEDGLNKRIKNYIKTLNIGPATKEIAPVGSFTISLREGALKITNRIPSRGWGMGMGMVPVPPPPEEGFTYTRAFTIEFNNIQCASRKKLCEKIAEVIQNNQDACELTTEADCTNLMTHFESDNPEALRKEAYENAMTSIRKQAENLAKLSDRTLGRVRNIKDNLIPVAKVSSTYTDTSSFYSRIVVVVDLDVEFELKD